jgi:hypothetical protein
MQDSGSCRADCVAECICVWVGCHICSLCWPHWQSRVAISSNAGNILLQHHRSIPHNRTGIGHGVSMWPGTASCDMCRCNSQHQSKILGFAEYVIAAAALCFGFYHTPYMMPNCPLRLVSTASRLPGCPVTCIIT